MKNRKKEKKEIKVEKNQEMDEIAEKIKIKPPQTRKGTWIGSFFLLLCLLVAIAMSLFHLAMVFSRQIDNNFLYTYVSHLERYFDSNVQYKADFLLYIFLFAHFFPTIILHVSKIKIEAKDSSCCQSY